MAPPRRQRATTKDVVVASYNDNNFEVAGRRDGGFTEFKYTKVVLTPRIRKEWMEIEPLKNILVKFNKPGRTPVSLRAVSTKDFNFVAFDEAQNKNYDVESITIAPDGNARLHWKAYPSHMIPVDDDDEEDGVQDAPVDQERVEPVLEQPNLLAEELARAREEISALQEQIARNNGEHERTSADHIARIAQLEAEQNDVELRNQQLQDELDERPTGVDFDAARIMTHYLVNDDQGRNRRTDAVVVNNFLARMEEIYGPYQLEDPMPQVVVEEIFEMDQ